MTAGLAGGLGHGGTAGGSMSPAVLIALLSAAERQATAAAVQPQTSSSKPAAAASETSVSGVTVVGGKQAVQTSIDRRSYDVTRDLQATSGSVADALRNVPSVDVSPQGDVSMRGAGVTIMVDGKISAAFKGPNGGLALQSLPASQIERVEVITKPIGGVHPRRLGRRHQSHHQEKHPSRLFRRRQSQRRGRS